MSTRSMLMAAVVTFAFPLAAAPVFAQGSGAGTGSFLGSTYRMEHKNPEGGEHTQMSGGYMAKKKAPAHAAAAKPHAPKYASVPTGSTTTDQLNQMSLAAAKQGQNYAPPPPADTGAKKKM